MKSAWSWGATSNLQAFKPFKQFKSSNVLNVLIVLNRFLNR